jgi:hypothetical protein
MGSADSYCYVGIAGRNSMTYQLNEASFLKDVAKHEMVVIRNDGINRHIRFKQPGSSNMYFDLVTWSGVLCYTGDMGTYVFTRIEDMFQFFRVGNTDWNYNDKGLSINLGYWSEKLIAVSSHGRSGGSAEEFDDDRFKEIVKRHVIEWIRSHKETTSKEERRELWESVVSNVIHADSDSDGHRQQIAAYDYQHIVNDSLTFYFQDLFDNRFTKYTHQFHWCCYAIAWGIEQFDKAQEAVAA